jgi:[ribosomal protein S18]-alanine N-acetyltransferase
MAALHAACFVDAPPPWSADAFAAAQAAGAFQVAQEGGFALGRVIAGEAELLTLAVDPARRREGLGRRLLAAFEAEAARLGAEQAFLEVSETNQPARALYGGAGWVQAGRRPGYYAGTAALILAKPIRDRSPRTSS